MQSTFKTVLIFFFACPKLHFVLQLLACKEGEQVAAVDSLFQSRLFD